MGWGNASPHYLMQYVFYLTWKRNKHIRSNAETAFSTYHETCTVQFLQDSSSSSEGWIRLKKAEVIVQELKEKFLTLIHSGADTAEVLSVFGVDHDSLSPEVCSLMSNPVMIIAMMAGSIRGMNNQVIKNGKQHQRVQRSRRLSHKGFEWVVLVQGIPVCDWPR